VSSRTPCWHPLWCIRQGLVQHSTQHSNSWMCIHHINTAIKLMNTYTIHAKQHVSSQTQWWLPFQSIHHCLILCTIHSSKPRRHVLYSIQARHRRPRALSVVSLAPPKNGEIETPQTPLLLDFRCFSPAEAGYFDLNVREKRYSWRFKCDFCARVQSAPAIVLACVTYSNRNYEYV